MGQRIRSKKNRTSVKGYAVKRRNNYSGKNINSNKKKKKGK